MKILVLVTLFFTAVGTAIFSSGLNDPIVLPPVTSERPTATARMEPPTASERPTATATKKPPTTSDGLTATATMTPPTTSDGPTATPTSEPPTNPDDIFFEAPPQYSEPLGSASKNNSLSMGLMLILMAACLCSL